MQNIPAVVWIVSIIIGHLVWVVVSDRKNARKCERLALDAECAELRARTLATYRPPNPEVVAQRAQAKLDSLEAAQ